MKIQIDLTPAKSLYLEMAFVLVFQAITIQKQILFMIVNTKRQTRWFSIKKQGAFAIKGTGRWGLRRNIPPESISAFWNVSLP